MRVLVTGAGGQLGHDVAMALGGTVPPGGRRCALFGPEGDRPSTIDVVAADHAALPVENRSVVLQAFDGIRPDVVVHAGAYTAVDDCELDRERAFRVNALGTRNVAESASRYGAHVVYLSTDYVFDGDARRPYVEWDTPAPRSAYGQSKLGGEHECPEGATIVRTSWVCGFNGHNMVKTVLRLAEGDGPLRFVDDQHGSPTFTADLAAALVTLATDRVPGLFHVTNQGATTWYGFARAVLDSAGHDPGRVHPIQTADLVPPRAAPRPAYSVLDNTALRLGGYPELPDWRDGLDRLVVALRGSDRRPVTPAVVGVVVDYQSGPVLAECISSLLADGVGDVVVVENGDRGEAQAVLDGAGLGVPILASGRNLGYGAGANRGVAALDSTPYALICNPDLHVHRGALDALVQALDAEPAWAIVGPRILTPEGLPYPSVRRFPSMVDAAGHAIIGLAFPDNRFTRRYRSNRSSPDSPSEADWVSGACFLVRRAAFEELGGFDERYFMFAEDMDLCWRAHEAGWGVGHQPAASVTHVQGVSTRRHPYKMVVAHHRSALRFARRSTRGWRRIALPLAALVLGLRLVISMVAVALRRPLKG